MSVSLFLEAIVLSAGIRRRYRHTVGRRIGLVVRPYAVPQRSSEKTFCFSDDLFFYQLKSAWDKPNLVPVKPATRPAK